VPFQSGGDRAASGRTGRLDTPGLPASAGGRSVVLPEALCVLTLTAQRCQKETKVTSAEQDPGHGASDAQRHREERRHADQDRTLLAMQQLEAALGYEHLTNALHAWCGARRRGGERNRQGRQIVARRRSDTAQR
jgi:hypothetical protein